jgi:uncharacterized protein
MAGAGQRKAVALAQQLVTRISDTRAVIRGKLAARLKTTDKVVEAVFAIILTMSGGRITRFQMLEDSFAVSRAART